MHFFNLREQSNLRPLLAAASFSVLLTVVKLIAFLMTGSLVVLGSLLDSLADSIMSFLNHHIHNFSKEQADQEHPFGHGGFEVVGSLVQGMVIGFFGVSLLIESIRKMRGDNAHHFSEESIVFTCIVLIGSSLGGLAIQKFLEKRIKHMEGENERSLSLMSERAHYYGDALANFMSALGLLFVYFTKIWVLDACFGCLSALMLIGTSIPVLKKCFSDIIQMQASPKLQQKIVDIIIASSDSIKGIHLLRTREFGPYLFVDFHLKLDRRLSLQKAHEISDAVENEIKKKFPRADILIHLDPDSEPDPTLWEPSYEIN